MNFKAALAFSFVALSLPVIAHADEPTRRVGDVQVQASLPYGFPEGVVVAGGVTYVSGPATFGTAGQGPSYIDAFDTATGRSLGAIPLAGEDLTQEHALSCITTDGNGRLYALSTQLGVVRIDPATGAQEVYATIPHLAQCNALPPGPCRSGDLCTPNGIDCSSGRCLPPGPCTPQPGGSCLPPGPCAPVAVDRGVLANDLAFDRSGNLYITDSFQATIFRVRPGGGQAEVYFQDPRMDTSTLPGFSIGMNGIRMTPDPTWMAFTVSFGSMAGVYKLLSTDVGYAPAYTLQKVRAYTNGELPDGLAFGASGRMYVALAGTNQIGVFDALGREFYRLSSPLYDNPANVAFNGAGQLLVTNHAMFGNPADGGLLNVQAFDTAVPLYQPIVP